MYTKEQLEEWVRGFKVTDDKKTQLLAMLADPEILPEIGNSIMRQSDYSRQMDTLRSEREAVSSKQQEVIDLERQLIEWRETNSPLFAEAVEQRDQMRTELKQMADAYIAKGGSLSEFGRVAATPPATAPATAFDESKYVARDEYEKAMKATVPALAQWTAQALQIDREHYELTGQHPDLDKVLAEVYKGKPARQAWEDSHGIAAIRSAKAEEDVLKRIDAAKAEERSRVLTEQAVDPHARTDNGATKSFLEGLGIGIDDQSKVAQNDALSRARASKALEGFNPYAT